MNMYLPIGQSAGILHQVDEGRSPLLTEKARTLLIALKLPMVGPVAVRKLAESVGPGSNFAASKDFFDNKGLQKSDAEYERALVLAESVIDRCAQKGIAIISMLDEAYPKRLRNIIDAPPVLYVLGNLGSLQGVSCAVVGTRHASDYGLKIAYRISAALVESGICVISGLALGIDTAAHEGALSNHGTTVAVMAHGLDTVAPTSNKKLAARILEAGGALISEHEPGVPPRPAEFVRRNRIQSGTAICSIIVESGEVGGSMHQARFTKSQGRPVLAILPENGNGALQGFNHEGGRLLVAQHGATRIRNTEDLMLEVNRMIGLADTLLTVDQKAMKF